MQCLSLFGPQMAFHLTFSFGRMGLVPPSAAVGHPTSKLMRAVGDPTLNPVANINPLLGSGRPRTPSSAMTVQALASPSGVATPPGTPGHPRTPSFITPAPTPRSASPAEQIRPVHPSPSPKPSRGHVAGPPGHRLAREATAAETGAPAAGACPVRPLPGRNRGATGAASRTPRAQSAPPNAVRGGQTPEPAEAQGAKQGAPAQAAGECRPATAPVHAPLAAQSPISDPLLSPRPGTTAGQRRPARRSSRHAGPPAGQGVCPIPDPNSSTVSGVDAAERAAGDARRRALAAAILAAFPPGLAPLAACLPVNWASATVGGAPAASMERGSAAPGRLPGLLPSFWALKTVAASMALSSPPNCTPPRMLPVQASRRPSCLPRLPAAVTCTEHIGPHDALYSRAAPGPHAGAPQGAPMGHIRACGATGHKAGAGSEAAAGSQLGRSVATPAAGLAAPAAGHATGPQAAAAGSPLPAQARSLTLAPQAGGNDGKAGCRARAVTWAAAGPCTGKHIVQAGGGGERGVETLKQGGRAGEGAKHHNPGAMGGDGVADPKEGFSAAEWHAAALLWELRPSRRARPAGLRTSFELLAARARARR